MTTHFDGRLLNKFEGIRTILNHRCINFQQNENSCVDIFKWYDELINISNQLVNYVNYTIPNLEATGNYRRVFFSDSCITSSLTSDQFKIIFKGKELNLQYKEFEFDPGPSFVLKRGKEQFNIGEYYKINTPNQTLFKQFCIEFKQNIKSNIQYGIGNMIEIFILINNWIFDYDENYKNNVLNDNLRAVLDSFKSYLTEDTDELEIK